MLVRTELSAGFLHCNACAVRCYGPQTRSNSRGYLLSLRPCPSKISLQHVCRVGGEKTSKASDNRAVSGQDKAGIPYAKQAFLGLWMASGVGVYTLLSSDAKQMDLLFDKSPWLGKLTCVLTQPVNELTYMCNGDGYWMLAENFWIFTSWWPLLTQPLAPAALVRPTGDVRGNGAFAVVPIMKGQRICNYEGELIDVADYWERYPSGASDYVMRIDDEYALDARDLAPRTAQFSAVHMNHSRRGICQVTKCLADSHGMLSTLISLNKEGEDMPPVMNLRRPNVGRFYARSEKRVSFYALRDISVRKCPLSARTDMTGALEACCSCIAHTYDLTLICALPLNLSAISMTISYMDLKDHAFAACRDFWMGREDQEV
eukprot:200453-Pelagomonas_calceolata.AAC.1